MSGETETPASNEADEAAIAACVRHFYAEARGDARLGPMFEATIDDWDAHLGIVVDFWSNALLQTGRYKSFPYPVHVNLPIELEDFDRWLALFEAAAKATLPARLADQAIARARHMTQSFRAGIFPFTDKQGRPSRQPG